MDPLSTSIAVLLSDPKSADLFEQFLNERCFLKNVTPATLDGMRRRGRRYSERSTRNRRS